jgi:RHH-type proline utilization regulon transcriptional repressor/proline dehydrogenase/delta 1-pyrroline-5-carboxylate dehydrogenase
MCGGIAREVTSPIDGRALGTVREADAATAGAAMAAAAAGFSAWAATALEERAQALERAAARLEADRGRLLALLQNEGGKTLDDALAEWREAIDKCR